MKNKTLKYKVSILTQIWWRFTSLLIELSESSTCIKGKSNIYSASEANLTRSSRHSDILAIRKKYYLETLTGSCQSTVLKQDNSSLHLKELMKEPFFSSNSMNSTRSTFLLVMTQKVWFIVHQMVLYSDRSRTIFTIKKWLVWRLASIII